MLGPSFLTATAVAPTIGAFSALLWPLIVAFLLWRLLPTIMQILSTRSFTLKVGQVEFTAQQLTNKVIANTADLQATVSSLTQKVSSFEEHLTHTDYALPPAMPKITEILWVEGVADTFAYERQQLTSLGASLVVAKSTAEALEVLDKRRFDVVVTETARSEEGAYDPGAGLKLVRLMRARHIVVPVVLYGSGLSESQMAQLSGDAAFVASASPQALFTQLSSIGQLP